MPIEKFSALLQSLGKGRFKNPDKLAESIKKVFIGIEKVSKNLDKAIEQLVVVLPEYQCLTSISGIITEIGHIERFNDQTKLAKYASLSWKVKQYGNYQSEHTPLTKQGNRYFRYYLVEAANSVRRHLPNYAEFYKEKYQETPKS